MRSFVLRAAIVLSVPLSTVPTGVPSVSAALASTSVPHSPLKCPPAWSFVPYVAGAGAPATVALSTVSGVAPDDVWGVGQTAAGTAVALHFDGSSWNSAPQPAVPGSLNAVAAIAPDDAWAVGTRKKARGSRTLVERWDGASWTRVPDAGATGFSSGTLTRVVADGPSDVWALGRVGDRRGNDRVIIERWGGSAWSETPPPESASAIQVSDLAVLSPSDAWLVGRVFGQGTMAQHFDGTTWSIVPTPNVGKFVQSNALFSITAVAPSDVWAGGQTGRHHTPPLIEHWNGLAWSVVQSTGQHKTAFTSMLAVSPDDVWAVAPRNGTTIEHWDGRGWQQVFPIPTRGHPVFLGRLGSAGAGAVWAGAGARICPVVLSDTGMSPRDADTSSPIPLRAVRVTRLVPRTVAWRVDPFAGQTGTISEISLGLFDSGPILPGGSFTFSFQAAGTYSVQHEPSGKIGSVGIPVRVRPPHGSITQVFHVSWGFGRSDVQVMAPGSTRFVMWRHGTFDRQADFAPTDPLWAGPGEYAFRARLREGGRMTGWSPTTAVRVG